MDCPHLARAAAVMTAASPRTPACPPCCSTHENQETRKPVDGRCVVTISGFPKFSVEKSTPRDGAGFDQSRAGNTDLAPYSSGYRRSEQAHNGVRSAARPQVLHMTKELQ